MIWNKIRQRKFITSDNQNSHGISFKSENFKVLPPETRNWGLGCNTLGTWARCRGDRNENFELPRVHFFFIRVNEKNQITFFYSEEMKFSAIFQLRGEAECEVKNSIFWIVSQIRESRKFKNDFGIEFFSQYHILESTSSNTIGFRWILSPKLISQSSLVKLH